MPLMLFASLDVNHTRSESNPDGNFQQFYDILHQTGHDQDIKNGDPHLQAGRKPKTRSDMEVDSIDLTGDGKGPVAPLASGPDSHEATESAATGSDDPRRSALPVAPVHYDERSDFQMPFASDALEATGQEIGPASASAEEKLMHMTKPQDTRHLVVFRPTTSALERQRQLDSEQVYIFTQPPALCDDTAAQSLLAQLVTKYAETAPWPTDWYVTS